MKEPDKRRSKFRRSQEISLHDSAEQQSWGSGLTSQSIADHPASSRLAKTVPQSPFSLTSLQNRLPARGGPHSHSETAIGHIHMKKKSSSSKKDKKKEKENRDSHPLNLPPDELRRLSAAMAAQEGARDSMDLDSNGPVPSQNAESPGASSKAAPGAFPEDANGTENGVNGDLGDEKSPAPPPHRVQIAEKPIVDAEAAKAAGNKFFKAKDYSRAIVEYTKGW